MTAPGDRSGAEWEQLRGRYAVWVNPSSPRLRSLAPSAEVSFVPMEAVGEMGGLDLGRTVELAEASGGYTEFQDGDVVVAKITPCFENGKGALAGNLVSGAAFGTTELHVLRARPGVDPRFIFYVTLGRPFRSEGEGSMYGAGGQKRVPPEFIKNFVLSVPPLDEQRAIAAFLDDRTARIDTLIEKKRALIEKLREKRAALISRTVTCGLPPDAARAAGLDPDPPMKDSGVEWLGEVPAGWEVSKIKYLAKIESGHTPSKTVDEYWVDCTIPWVSLRDSGYLRTHDYISDTFSQISELGMANSSAHLLPAGAVVFSRDATVGLCAITLQPMAVSQHFIAYVCGPRLMPGFLLLCLKAMGQHLERVSMGSTIPTIGMPDVYALECPVPSLEEQQALVKYAAEKTARIDRMIEAVDMATERLRDYRSALITAAVTGKIDVRGRAKDAGA